MQSPTQNLRLDELLVERRHFATLERARAAIMAGQVWSKGQRLTKPGTSIERTTLLEMQAEKTYVSRGGEKLAHALEHFQISPAQRTCLDIGTSTGGFTDCLLQKGAASVVAVDTGYGRIHEKLRTNPKVILREKTNARYLTSKELGDAGDKIDLVTVDVSFISLRKILPALVSCLSKGADFIFLFKPQFELDRKDILPGGLARKDKITSALEEFQDFCRTLKLELRGTTPSPLTGKKGGNIEICLHYRS